MARRNPPTLRSARPLLPGFPSLEITLSDECIVARPIHPPASRVCLYQRIITVVARNASGNRIRGRSNYAGQAVSLPLFPLSAAIPANLSAGAGHPYGASLQERGQIRCRVVPRICRDGRIAPG